LSDVLKLNEEELVVVAEMLSISGSQDDVQAELLRRYSLRLVVLTRGEGGSVIRSADRTSVCPGQKVRVVDTVGAGDAFTAAVAVGLLGGEDLDTVHRHAARVAAFVCTRAGATPDVPLELRQF
jgi:fructokinase